MNAINKEMIEALFTAFVGQAVQLVLNNYYKLREQIVAGVTAKNKKELYAEYKGKITEVWDNYNALLSLLLPYGDYLDISEIKATWITGRDNAFKDLTAQLANYNIRKSYVRVTSQQPFEIRTLNLNQESLIAFTDYAVALSLQVFGYQQVYEITYKLSQPVELTDTPFWLKELGEDEITYYKSEGYDGLIYSPAYPTTEKSVGFVHIFNPSEAILDFKILNEGYVDPQKGFWVETLNN